MTAGESHGPALTGILEGLPAGLQLNREYIDAHLTRRQWGYGRGGRMKIEHDQVEILSGVRFGITIGSPIAMRIVNRDWENWEDRMSIEGPDSDTHRVTLPRPGHADYAGGVKYGHSGDMRNVLERASARETAMRVALGSAARRFLEDFGITLGSVVLQIGSVQAALPFGEAFRQAPDLEEVDRSPVRCADSGAEEEMIAAIDLAREAGDTLGGVIAVWAEGLPIGLGSHVHWDRRLDGRLAQGLMSIPAVKGVEIGPAFENATLPGSAVHDPFRRAGEEAPSGSIARSTNRAGGLEGGISNGELLIARAAMKPLSTLRKPIGSVDLETGEEQGAHVERSDVCAVPAAGIVAESVVALSLADAFLEKFGGDAMDDIRAAHDHYRAGTGLKIDAAGETS
jgi:chorismate synthase